MATTDHSNADALRMRAYAETLKREHLDLGLLSLTSHTHFVLYCLIFDSWFFYYFSNLHDRGRRFHIFPKFDS
jgi:hypothetical protein